MVSSYLSKIRENIMEVSYGLYWRFLVDMAYLKESVENAFLMVSFTQKKCHVEPSVK